MTRQGKSHVKLLIYDFVGCGPNDISRSFFRKINLLLNNRDNGLQRIQKSVVLGVGDLDELKHLVERHGGNYRVFRVVEEG